MTNVGAFDNDGSDNFRIFSTNDLIFSTTNGEGTTLRLDSSTKDAEFFGDVSGSATSTGSFGIVQSTGLTANESVIVGADGKSLISTDLFTFDTVNNHLVSAQQVQKLNFTSMVMLHKKLKFV